MDRPEITWTPRRMQVFLHEDRRGDVHVRIESQPSGRSVTTVAIREGEERVPLKEVVFGLVALVDTIEVRPRWPGDGEKSGGER